MKLYALVLLTLSCYTYSYSIISSSSFETINLSGEKCIVSYEAQLDFHKFNQDSNYVWMQYSYAPEYSASFQQEASEYFTRGYNNMTTPNFRSSNSHIINECKNESLVKIPKEMYESFDLGSYYSKWDTRKSLSERIVLNQKVLVYIHPSKYFFGKAQLEGLNKLVDLSKDLSIYSILVMDKKSADFSQRRQAQYIVQADQVDSTYISSSGAHEIKFSDLNELYLAGGNLGRCLCDALRSSIYHSKNTQNLKIYLVSDAIYLYRSLLEGITEVDTSASSHYTLDEVVNKLTDLQLAELLRVKVFSIKPKAKHFSIQWDYLHSEGDFCAHQRSTDHVVDASLFQISIWNKDKKLVSQFGSNNPKAKKLDVYITDSSLIEKDNF